MTPRRLFAYAIAVNLLAILGNLFIIIVRQPSTPFMVVHVVCVLVNAIALAACMKRFIHIVSNQE